MSENLPIAKSLGLQINGIGYWPNIEKVIPAYQSFDLIKKASSVSDMLYDKIDYVTGFNPRPEKKAFQESVWNSVKEDYFVLSLLAEFHEVAVGRENELKEEISVGEFPFTYHFSKEPILDLNNTLVVELPKFMVRVNFENEVKIEKAIELGLDYATDVFRNDCNSGKYRMPRFGLNSERLNPSLFVKDSDCNTLKKSLKDQ